MDMVCIQFVCVVVCPPLAAPPVITAISPSSIEYSSTTSVITLTGQYFFNATVLMCRIGSKYDTGTFLTASGQTPIGQVCIMEARGCVCVLHVF
jgi:hypothetical protein